MGTARGVLRENMRLPRVWGWGEAHAVNGVSPHTPHHQWAFNVGEYSTTYLFLSVPFQVTKMGISFVKAYVWSRDVLRCSDRTSHSC